MFELCHDLRGFVNYISVVNLSCILLILSMSKIYSESSDFMFLILCPIFNCFCLS